MKRNKGFTMIELMIAVAIIGILSAVAIPAYSEYVKRGKITEALNGLSAMRVSLEQWYQDRRTYRSVPANGTACGVAVPASQNFDFACSAASADTYTITATGVTTKGMSGFTYTVNEQNVKGSTITSATGWTATTASCWVTKQDGSC